MNSVPPPDSFESADYFGVLRRRWKIVLGLTCVGLLGAFAYVVVAPKAYSATAGVNVTPTAADQSNTVQGSRTSGATVNLDTEAQVVMSTRIATIAAHILHSSLPPTTLSKQIAVTVPPNSSVLDIACHASSGQGAAACANAFAQAYLQDRSATATTMVNSQIHTLQGKLTPALRAQTDLSNKIRALPKKSSQKLTDTTQLKSVEGQVRSLQHQINTLTGQLANTSGGSIINTPPVPTSPSSPKKALVLPSGLVVGLVLGLVVAFFWDRRDKRLHGDADVERRLGLPVALSLPDSAFGRSPSLAAPRSKTGQAFTELAQAIAATLGEGNHVLLVAGTAPGAGTSIIAANLAATIARTHSAAVLVSANLNTTVAPQLLGLRGGAEGLAELLAGTADVRDVAQAPAAVPRLWVIPPGADLSLAGYDFQHDTVRAITSQLRKDAQFVVIEVQATHEEVDSFAFSEFADAALIAVEKSRTTQPMAMACIRRLHQLRTPILGAVVYPEVGKRVSVRPPRQPQTRPGSGPGEPALDGAEAARGHRPLPQAAASAEGQDRTGRPIRTRNGYSERADRVPGS